MKNSNQKYTQTRSNDSNSPTLHELELLLNRIEELDAIRNKNDDVKIRSAIGLAYYEINKKEDSLNYFNFALELDRNYLPALQYKALILMENDNYEEALKLLIICMSVLCSL